MGFGMNKPIIAALSVVLLVSACASVRQSRVNPMNWFGASQTVTIAPGDGFATATPDPRPTAEQITQMSVERMPGGAILRAAALPPTQGWWAADLVPEFDGQPVDGVLVYRFALLPPEGATRVSTPQSRELTAAVFIPDARLSQARQIIVRGALNERSVTR